MRNPYILLWLEGPLQSWGADSRYDRRNTLDFPTKSGMMGLICAALGAGGKQCELLSEFAFTDMQVFAFPRQEHNKRNAITPILQDFQMVGSGYDDRDPWQALLIPKMANGKKANSNGTKLTYRYYLQDMAFAVALEVPAQRKTAISEALIAPIWDLCLGRKCCTPTEFIYQGTFEDIDEAKNSAYQLAESKQRALSFYVRQGKFEGDEVLTLNDVPLQFGENKLYADRIVTLCYPTES